MSTPQRPGWYPAPDGSPGEQWWNGAGWSESRRGAAAAPTQAPTATPAVSPHRPDPYALAHRGVTPPGQLPLPAARPVSVATANSAATISFVLGLVSLGLGIVGIPAIILGLIGMSRAKVIQPPSAAGKWMALAGIILGAFGLVMGLIPFLIFLATLADFS